MKLVLEPESASDIKTSAGGQVRSGNRVAGELRKRESVSKKPGSGILDERVNGCEIGVVECVQRREAEFERSPLVKLNALGHAGIQIVKGCIAADIAWRIAKRGSENGFGDSAVRDVTHLLVGNRYWRICSWIKRCIGVVRGCIEVIEADQVLACGPSGAERCSSSQGAGHEEYTRISLENSNAVHRRRKVSDEWARRIQTTVELTQEAGIKEINRDKHDEERRSVLTKPRSADGDDPYWAGISVGEARQSQSTSDLR